MTLTTKNLPANVNVKQATHAELSDSIVAKPLGEPDFVNVRSKNPGLSFRWVNFVAGQGMRFQQCSSMGFIVATAADCDVPGIVFKDGAFRNGDLILMKIGQREYLGALKNNYMKANSRVSRESIGKMAKTELQTSLGTQSLSGKISSFVPSDNEAEGVLARNAEK